MIIYYIENDVLTNYDNLLFKHIFNSKKNILEYYDINKIYPTVSFEHVVLLNKKKSKKTLRII